MNRYLGALLLLPVLSACSGGGASAPQATSQLVFPAQVTPVSSAREALQSSKAASLPYSAEYLYVSNFGVSRYDVRSVTIYAHDAIGNTAPLGVISGSKTQIDNPGDLSQDAAGNLYVANGNKLLVFAHGATGNVAPIRVLTGPLTGIHSILAMTVDKATNKIFISDATSGSFSGAMLRFAPNSTGNVAPFARSLPTGFIKSVTQDSTGNNLIQFTSSGPEDVGQAVGTYGKQFANGAAEPPVPNHFVTAIPRGHVSVADDASTKTYLLSAGGLIYRLPEAESGSFDHPPLSRPIVSEITSNSCPSVLAVQAPPYPNTYAAQSAIEGCAADQVVVYNNAANGNAAPLRLLKGPATQLNNPVGIYEGK